MIHINSSILGLYIHSPWCWQKCPYCDFNAYHKPKGEKAMALLEQAYLNALLKDLYHTKRHYPWLHTLNSIYLGGGTPSLLSAQYWKKIFTALKSNFTFSSNIEITMEISPKTSMDSLLQFQFLGINRFSVGVQSFNPLTLSTLGREHDPQLSYQILDFLSQMDNIRVNVDLIYGLASQTCEEVESDLKIALSFPVNHLSWYELTIEPHTQFALTPHIKGSEELLTDFEEIGTSSLCMWDHYEISAYCRNKERSQHNILYWTYGDYLGIGAGSHSKITLKPGVRTHRFYKTRYPQDYFKSQREIADHSVNDALDFLLLRLRLFSPLKQSEIQKLPYKAQIFLQYWWDLPHDPALLLRDSYNSLSLTALGRRSINTLLDQLIDTQKSWEKSK